MGNKGSTGNISDAELAALKANSNLSEQEIREMYLEFQKGGGGDGKITKQEFSKYYKKSVGIDDKNGILADNTFAAFDSNHDGSISFTEFTFAILAQNKTDLDSILNFSFEVLDTSGDGHVSFDELKNYMEKAMILAVGQEEAATVDSNESTQALFKEFGLNQTQKLNKQQFIEGCKKNKELANMFTGNE
ncbi:unnamed protein product [Adineta ricciae]|uniref:EF-hand domain-containing protein n=1 Tax=Adineta ricciae TaxID=249248 RepID=A0A813RIJ1_ADIRI|nr:unnamed protein product [Adineta ricciae]CAF1276530.1 unnamed protein product [Adineta ricciae]